MLQGQSVKFPLALNMLNMCVSVQFSLVFGFTGDIMNTHRTNNYTHRSIFTTKIVITPKVW